MNRYLPGGLSFAFPDMRHLGLLGASLRALANLARAKGYRLARVAGSFDAIFVRGDLWREEEELPLSGHPRPEVLRLLTRGDFHTTSAAALAAGGPVRVHHGWGAECIREAFEELCASPDLGPLCGAA